MACHAPAMNAPPTTKVEIQNSMASIQSHDCGSRVYMIELAIQGDAAGVGMWKGIAARLNALTSNQRSEHS